MARSVIQWASCVRRPLVLAVGSGLVSSEILPVVKLPPGDVSWAEKIHSLVEANHPSCLMAAPAKFMLRGSPLATDTATSLPTTAAMPAISS